MTTITTRTFDIVNVGTTANDGTGDGLRDAFIRVNSNFANITSTGFTAANIRVTKTLFIENATNATSANTGALVTDGGAGIGKDLYVGGNLIILGNTITVEREIVTVSETVSGNSTVTGTVTADNLSANTVTVITASVRDTTTSGNLVANSGVDSSSIGTGALIVTGGASITGNTYILGNIVTGGTFTKKYQDSSDVNTSSKTLDFDQGGDELLYLNINTNVAIGYSATIVAGRQVDVTIKNTSGGLLYAHLPNANTNKASGNIQIADQSWTRLVFTAFGTTTANVVVAVTNN